MTLTREQAQAVADVIAPHADEYYDLVERAQECFPEYDWIALCLPDWVDPRPRIPPVPFIGPKLPNEHSRHVDRIIVSELIAACRFHSPLELAQWPL